MKDTQKNQMENFELKNIPVLWDIESYLLTV